jgi:hypothetical protein
MFLIGLLGMGAMSTLQRLVEHPPTLIQITLSEASARRRLEQMTRTLNPEVIEAEIIEQRVQEQPWQVRNEDLLGIDNKLALAKLRIDLESELRKIAHQAGVEPYITSRASARRLAEELSKRELLARPFISLLDDILPTLNRAIHGGAVPTDTAASIIRIGSELLFFLRATASQHVSDRGA